MILIMIVQSCAVMAACTLLVVSITVRAIYLGLGNGDFGMDKWLQLVLYGT